MLKSTSTVVSGRARRHSAGVSTVAKLFVAVLVIVVFEGALRKWVSEAFTTPLVLLRDIIAFATVIYAIAAKHLTFRRASGTLLGAWSLIVVGWALLQAVVNEIPLVIVAVGLRFWLLYLWFAVAVGVSLTESDYKFILKVSMWIMLVQAPLVVLQYLQPPNAFINKQVSDDEGDLIFTVIYGVVRTTGTFSFTFGFTSFLAIVTPIAFGFITAKFSWARGDSAPREKFLRGIGLAAMLIGTMVSGSRTAFVNFFIVSFVYLMYLFLITRVRLQMKTYVSIAAGVVITGVLALTFSSALDAIEERSAGAAEAENVPVRVLEMFIGTPELRENFEILGNGLGFGANFAGVILSGERAFLNGETEIERTLYSAGLLGLAFVVAKLATAAVAISRAFVLARSGSPLPLLFWITATIAMLTWAVTGQLTANAVGFILLSFAIASLRFPAVGATR